jgi:hypothetical protein
VVLEAVVVPVPEVVVPPSPSELLLQAFRRRAPKRADPIVKSLAFIRSSLKAGKPQRCGKIPEEARKLLCYRLPGNLLSIPGVSDGSG